MPALIVLLVSFLGLGVLFSGAGTIELSAAQASRLGWSDEAIIRANFPDGLTAENLDARINDALDAGNREDALAYRDLAVWASVPLPPATLERVDPVLGFWESVAKAGSDFADAVGNAVDGCVFNAGEDATAFQIAGMIGCDLTAFGSARDTAIQGFALTQGRDPDWVILGLSVADLAITFTPAVFVSAPAKIGASVLKTGRKIGTLSTRFAGRLARMLDDAVGFEKLRATMKAVDLSNFRATGRAVANYAEGLRGARIVRVMGDGAEIATNAGSVGAVRLLRYVDTADDLSDVARVARVAKGSTVALFKLGLKPLRLMKIAWKVTPLLLPWSVLWMMIAAALAWMFRKRIPWAAVARAPALAERRAPTF